MPPKAVVVMAGGKGAAPAVPTLTYTAEKQFTISNFDSNLTYTVTGGTLAGSVVTITTTGANATVTAKYPRGQVTTSSVTLATLAHSRVLTGSATNYTDTGCGPRGSLCCSGGQILNVNGSTCSSTGSLAPNNFCGGSCDGNCFQLTISCYSYYWTDYSGSGYTLYGSTWGKVT